MAPDGAREGEREELRFEFGENWRRFLSVLNEDRIREAERSLREQLACESLDGLTFLDLGSGSGLFSLAAFRLGARRVFSLDLDPASVACTKELRSRASGDPSRWQVEQASVLDREYVLSLGKFDIVYSWGVLHHTGALLTALENASLPVGPGGKLFIAIYNDQGRRSELWKRVKRLYNSLPAVLKTPYAVLVMGPRELWGAIKALIQLRPQAYVRMWTQYDRQRGMSRWHDLVDWVGGYPYEVATPGAILDFYRPRGFNLVRLVTRQGIGCNEFVFERSGDVSV
jgi:2-polyprenyl-6-hydroxyphenyl methylase/3-demethylubiquinone-9 3-methyltransferase